MPIRSLCTAVLFVTLIAGSSLSGQLGPGVRLRVTLKTAPSERLIGTLDSVARHTIHLRVEDEHQGAVLRLPLAAIGTVEVSRGRHSHAVRGAVGGGTILGGVCLVVGLKFQREQATLNFTRHDVALLTIVGAASGAYIGARRIGFPLREMGSRSGDKPTGCIRDP